MVNYEFVREDIITIDGPTSSGKNSVGFLLAQKLGYQYIDSGMLYRAGSFKIIQKSIPLTDKEKILEIFQNLNIRFETVGNKWKMFLDDSDVTNTLHASQISKVTSILAAMPEVRLIVKNIQHQLTQDGQAVVGGRDIGSEIFPDARHKFFLTASTEVRAKRRFKQLVEKDPSIKYEDVLKDMLDRDKRDAEREASPMRIPEGAKIIDNSKLSIEQTVGEMLDYIKN